MSIKSRWGIASATLMVDIEGFMSKVKIYCLKNIFLHTLFAMDSICSAAHVPTYTTSALLPTTLSLPAPEDQHPLRPSHTNRRTIFCQTNRATFFLNQYADIKDISEL